MDREALIDKFVREWGFTDPARNEAFREALQGLADELSDRKDQSSAGADLNNFDYKPPKRRICLDDE